MVLCNEEVWRCCVLVDELDFFQQRRVNGVGKEGVGIQLLALLISFCPGVVEIVHF